MRMNALGYFFLIATTIFSFLIPCIVIFSVDRPEPDGLVLIPFAAPAFFYLISWVFFAVEVGNASTALGRILYPQPAEFSSAAPQAPYIDRR